MSPNQTNLLPYHPSCASHVCTKLFHLSHQLLVKEDKTSKTGHRRQAHVTGIGVTLTLSSQIMKLLWFP